MKQKKKVCQISETKLQSKNMTDPKNNIQNRIAFTSKNTSQSLCFLYLTESASLY